MTYTTVQGDMWDSIAYNVLGSTSYTDKLMSVNSEYLDYYIFPAGIVLNVPQLAGEVSTTLPPWKVAAG